MPRVLLLLPAFTYRGEAFLHAASRLGVQVTIGCEEPGQWGTHQESGSLITLDFQQPSVAQRTVTEFSKHYPLDGIIGVEDSTSILAAFLSSALGLPHNPSDSMSAARNKFLMRTRFQEAGVPIPNFSVYSIDDDPQLTAPHVRFPCVVKPLTLSASCGVIRADDQDSFVKAFHRVKALLIHLGLTAKDEAGLQLLVEDFVPGPEVALEGLLTNGDLHTLALFDKPDPLEGPFFEETIYITPSRIPAETQQRIEETVSRAAAALGLREGPVHGELRINESGVWVIELAARSIGGRCSQTLRFGTGMSLEELILRHSLRMDLSAIHREDAASGVMMLPIAEVGYLKSVQGQTEALRITEIESIDITAQPGDLLVPLPEGTRYLGFLLARGSSAEKVEAALREAYSRLTVETSPPRDQIQNPGLIRA